MKLNLMKHNILMEIALVLGSLLLMGCQGGDLKNSTARDGSSGKDEFLWLENVKGERALNWVKKQNKVSLEQLQKKPVYNQMLQESLEILKSKERIPYARIRRGYAYNFWKDDQYLKGIWRRRRVHQYLKGKRAKKQWEILINFDELSQREGKSWFYQGASCLPPKYERCLVKMSDGGKDAHVLREFNVETKTFVKDGFYIPEAKSFSSWVDQDTLLVATNWGEGSLNSSGYARRLKLLKRGQDLTEASLVYEAPVSDVFMGGGLYKSGETSLVILRRGLDFFTSQYFEVSKRGELTRIDLPDHASVLTYFFGHVVFRLRKEWSFKGQEYPAGSVLSFKWNEFQRKNKISKVYSVYRPSQYKSFSSLDASKNFLYLIESDKVVHKLKRLQFRSGRWVQQEVSLPGAGQVRLFSMNEENDLVLFSFESFLQPRTLYKMKSSLRSLKAVYSQKSWFNSKGLQTQQFWVKSRDGEKIPYFVIHRQDLRFDGKNPTLLYGYGGFEIGLYPSYSPVQGRLWLERGGVYVLANIRGGGEFGAKWHRAALKENRQKAYDDFAVIAKDLIQRKITSPEHLGIRGGSNGGLLVGVAMTQNPQLYKAVMCLVPLLDMMRFHKLLAGASWMGEYGNPDVVEQRAYIRKYSPYQNVKRKASYPELFLLTSTEDDRVHPGHARKMAARMKAYGHSVLYYENMDGGHGVRGNYEKEAQIQALQYTFLYDTLAAAQVRK